MFNLQKLLKHQDDTVAKHLQELRDTQTEEAHKIHHLEDKNNSRLIREYEKYQILEEKLNNINDENQR